MDEDFQFEGGPDGQASEEAVDYSAMGGEMPPTPSSIPETAMPRRTSSDAAVMAPPPPSEATNKFKAENEKRIKQRDTEFTKAKQELAKKAEHALEKIRQERAQHIAKNAKANREAQAKTQAAAGGKADPSAPVNWKKFSQLIDLDKETTDRERMRLLFKAKVAEAK
jgi:hypothetical protein